MRKTVLLLASMALAVLLACGVALVGVEESARAAFPGKNGKIAFTRVYRPSYDEINYEIYTMNSDGTGAKRLTTNSAEDELPAWSPDGKKIAFSSVRTGAYYIYTMNPDGTGVKRLTNYPALGDYAPDWQPLP